jgi:hypothetical protein
VNQVSQAHQAYLAQQVNVDFQVVMVRNLKKILEYMTNVYISGLPGAPGDRVNNAFFPLKYHIFYFSSVRVYQEQVEYQVK